MRINLQTIFGDEIAGVPTETVLTLMQTQVWGGKVIFVIDKSLIFW